MYENDIRGFHRSDKAWYADINDIHLPEITFGVYSDCGGCMAELTVKWGKLYGEDLVPQLQVFNDAWRMLSEMKDLIDELAKYDKQNISADKFCEILLSLGFKDLTEYKRPEESDAKAKKINEREAKTQTKEL